MSKVGDLAALHTKYFDAGLRVVAISDEPVELLRKKMVDAAGATYWIGSDPDNATMKRYTGRGSFGIPHFYLVGADGKVISERLPKEADLRDLLERAHLLDKPLHAKLERARAAYEAGVFGVAHKQATALRKDKDSAVAADAALLCDKVEGHAGFLQTLMAASADDDVNTRYGELQRFAFQFDGLGPAKWAREQLAELNKHARVKSFLTEWKKLENAMRSEMLAEGNPDKLRLVKRLYEDVAKKYERSHVGQLAAAHAARLDGKK